MRSLFTALLLLGAMTQAAAQRFDFSCCSTSEASLATYTLESPAYILAYPGETFTINLGDGDVIDFSVNNLTQQGQALPANGDSFVVVAQSDGRTGPYNRDLAIAHFDSDTFTIESNDGTIIPRCANIRLYRLARSSGVNPPSVSLDNGLLFSIPISYGEAPRIPSSSLASSSLVITHSGTSASYSSSRLSISGQALPESGRIALSTLATGTTDFSIRVNSGSRASTDFDFSLVVY